MIRRVLLLVLPFLLLFVSLFVGRLNVGPGEVLRILAAQLLPMARSWPESVETIVLQIRLPRALMAMCVGAGLSISGAAFQGMFRNPLVSPDVLGVSAAAGFGAALAILLSRSPVELQLLAFAFGLGGVALTYMLARVYETTPVLMLVLSGVVVAAFFSALLSGTKFVADPENKLPAITYWLLGSFNSTTLAVGGHRPACDLPPARSACCSSAGSSTCCPWATKRRVRWACGPNG